MLTQNQRLELKAAMESQQRNFGGVTQEEMARFPAEKEDMRVVTSQGETKIIRFEYGDRTAERPLFLNLHGGGFIGGRMDRDELFCRKMACRFHALVLDIDYKLAPEYPYPRAVLECQAVAAWVWDNRKLLFYHPGKIVLMGHSSGGNLAAGICMKYGQTGQFKPCCTILDYPPLDLAKDPADKERSVCDMTAERARDYNLKYIKPEDRAEAYASPLYAQAELLMRFPDTLIVAAGEDSLCREDEEFALRLARAGVTVTLKRFTESVHGFVINRMCEWESAMVLIEGFVEQHIKKLEN